MKQGDRLNVMESSHEYFDRLCAMAAVNETSQEENRRLAEHARTCRVCKQAIEQYQQVAAQTYAEASFEMNARSEEHTSELQSRRDLVCRLLLEKKKKKKK